MKRSVWELTSAVVSGDTESFTAFFRAWFDAMYRDAHRATGRDESFCLDVVQDAMMRVIRSLQPMESETRLRNWLRVVVQSCAYDRLRKELRRRRWEQEAMTLRGPEAFVMETNSDLRCALAQNEARERVEWLRRQLAGLDDAHLRMVVLRFRFGWTLERIGRAVGLKPGAVDGKIRRIVSALRRRAKEASDA